jgi:ferredoxin-fold anticodon binding domain-containing protein
MKQLRELIGKQVEVIANGIVYKGILKDISEQSISILSTSGWLEIAMSSISKITEPGTNVFERKYVDPSFYRDV